MLQMAKGLHVGSEKIAYKVALHNFIKYVIPNITKTQNLDPFNTLSAHLYLKHLC